MHIALISPTLGEGKFLSRYLKKASTHPFTIYQGRIGKNRIALIISGIGKTSAASATTHIINKLSPHLLILFGVGGAYPLTGLSIGDIAVAEKEIYGDEGIIMKDGFHGLDLIGIPVIKKGKKAIFNEFHLNRGLLDSVKRYIYKPFKSGNFITLSSITGTVDGAIRLARRYNAICENMEGAAVAHVCEIFRRDLIEIRGISNIVEDRDPSKWDIKTAIRATSKTLLDILNHLH